jgi:alginate O-acetyltransferase complex protein AlgI
MLFTSPTFLLLFLPAMLGIYALTPARLRIYAICIFNVAFYAIANIFHPASVVFLLLTAIFAYCASFAAFSVKRRAVLVFALAVLLGALVVLRYLGVQAEETAARAYLPFGASFYLLAAISCVIDTRREDVKMPRTFIEVLAYVTFFPVMIVGPCVRFKDFIRLTDPQNLKLTAASVGSGIILFAQGFIKRVAIAAIIDETYDALVDGLLSIGDEPIGLNLAFILIILLLVGAYYSFSGFSDMGRGIAAMLGIKLESDFGSCLFVSSPVRYSQNFLLSLGVWINDYVTDPLMRFLTNQKKARLPLRVCRVISSSVGALAILLWFKMGLRTLPALLVVMLPVILESLFGLSSKLERTWWRKLLGMLYTLPFVSLFWILVRTRDLSVALSLISRLTLFTELQSYTMSLTFNNLELPLVVPLIVVTSLPYIAGVFARKKQSLFLRSEPLRWAYLSLILGLFLVTVFYFLPQYPELSTVPFHDIIF